LRLADVQGTSRAPNLANTKQAIENLSFAQALLEQVRAEAPRNLEAARLLSRVHHLRCRMLIYGDHDAAQALAQARLGAAALRPALQSSDLDHDLWQLRICEGDALTWLNRTKESVPLLSAELATALAARAANPKGFDDILLTKTYRFLGEAYYYDQNMPAAARELERGFDLIRSVRARDEADLHYLGEFMATGDTLAATYNQLGLDADGLAVAREARGVALLAHQRDPADIFSLRRALALSRIEAVFQASLGDAKGAQRLMAESYAKMQELLQRFPDDAGLQRSAALSLRPHGDVYRYGGDVTTACLWYRRAANAWDQFDKRFGASASDKTEDMAYAAQNLRACAGDGPFADS
jgi:hypothetical protein